MPITTDTLRALEARVKAVVQELEAIVAQAKAEEETTARGLYPEPRGLTRKA
jgi:hypothetical protein